MNKKLDVKTDLGNKVLVKTKCIIYSINYFEVLEKGKKKELDTFLCEGCQKNKWEAKE